MKTTIEVPEGKIVKQALIENGILITWEEDKNPMRKFKDTYDNDLKRFCQNAFDYKYQIMILDSATPNDRPKLLGRALWITQECEVKTFPSKDGFGTVIEFVKK